MATRCAIGVAIPVAVAASTGHAGVAALAALGALYAGLASYGGIYKARFRLMVASALSTAVSTSIGVWVSANHAFTMVCLFGLGLISSLYAVSSPSAATLGIQACAVFIVFSSLGLPPSEGLSSGLIVLGGALTQLFLLTVVWPLDPVHPERTAVADAIRGLALFVAEQTEGTPGTRAGDLLIPASQPFQDARSILEQADLHSWGPDHDWLLQVVQRAEAVRAALVGWARADEAYRALRPTAEVRARRIGRSLHRALMAIAVRVAQGAGCEDLAVPLRVPRIETPEPVSVEYAHWVTITKRLIHRFAEPALPPATANEPKPAGRSRWSPGVLFSALTDLPDVASLRTVSVQHALRYATGISVAALAARLTGLSHAYWFPLTVALVMRPDFATTYIRGLGRVAGTLAGVVLSSILLDLFHPPPLVLLCLMVAASWFCFALFQTGYAGFSLAITLYVVFSVTASGVAPAGIGLTRFLATLSGVALAFLIYAAWPAWSWRHLWEVLRDAVDAHLAYGRRFLTDPPSQRSEIDESRVTARRLRIQAENMVRSASLDPLARRHTARLKAATSATERLDRNAAEMLTIEAASLAGVSRFAPDMNAVLTSSEDLQSLIRCELSDDM